MLIFKYPCYQARLKIVGIFALTTIVTISALLLSIASDVFGATEQTTSKAISIKAISTTTENTTGKQIKVKSVGYDLKSTWGIVIEK